MGKFNTLAEFMTTNYSDVISEKLSDFILHNLDKVLLQEINKNYIGVDIEFIDILCIEYTKSELEYVEFDCMVNPNYYLVTYENGYKIRYRGIDQSFIVTFKGKFRNGFIIKEIKSGLSSDSKRERLTYNLVPIIKKEDMEDYATKFLNYYCPEALKTPLSIDVNKILCDKGIKWYLAPLPYDVYGKTYFGPDEVEVYDEKNNIRKISIDRGTILINQERINERTIGVVRNTIIHEAVHWFFHNNYFELRHLLNDEETCAVCYKSDNKIYSDEIKWMEVQARTLTPKILMPREMFLLKFEQIYEETVKYLQNRKHYIEYRDVDILEITMSELAKFFNVSKQTVKYRLIDLGYMQADGVYNYYCGKYARSYSFNPSKLEKYQTFFITKESLNNLILKDKTINALILFKKLVYIGGLLVVNDPKYVQGKKLTDYAIDHVDECCIIINTKSDTQPFDANAAKFILYSYDSTKKEAQVDYEQIQNLLVQSNSDFNDYVKHKSELPSTFGDTIDYHCSKYSSYEWVAEHCDITAVTLRKYRNDEVDNIKPIILIKFCLGLKLPYPYIQDLLNKASINLSRLTKTNLTLLNIITNCSKLGLVKIYEILKQTKQEEILNLSKNYKEKHNLIEKTR